LGLGNPWTYIYYFALTQDVLQVAVHSPDSGSTNRHYGEYDVGISGGDLS
jgi:hypothetical protein